MLRAFKSMVLALLVWTCPGFDYVSYDKLIWRRFAVWFKAYCWASIFCRMFSSLLSRKSLVKLVLSLIMLSFDTVRRCWKSAGVMKYGCDR